MTVLEVEPPDHVPADAVVRFDHLRQYGPDEYPPFALNAFRDDHRAFFSPLHGGFWMFTRYADIRDALNDADLFRQSPDGVPPTPYGALNIPQQLDPPEHTRYRKVLVPIFSARRIAELEGFLRAEAKAHLERLFDEPCEFVNGVALVLPAAMYCRMLGLPASDFEHFNRLAFDLVYGTALARAERGDAAARQVRADATAHMRAILAGVLAERRRRPSDDLLGHLMSVRLDDGSALTDNEILNIAGLFFWAGVDTTASAIAYAFSFLAGHPPHRAQLAEDPSVIPAAVEELLRYSGFHTLTRQVARDCSFAGVDLRSGDRVLLSMGAANHDPYEFAEPEIVDFDRNPRRHLTFGAGVHRCLGATLGSLQLRILLEEIHGAGDYEFQAGRSTEYITGMGKAVPHVVPLVLHRRRAPSLAT